MSRFSSPADVAGSACHSAHLSTHDDGKPAQELLSPDKIEGLAALSHPAHLDAAI